MPETGLKLTMEGDRYLFGYGVPQSASTAFRKYLEAASPPHNFATAQNSVGFMYENGVGCEVNYSSAMHYYELAAKQKFSEAINNLGLLYESGKGPSKDVKLAIKFYRDAAELECLDAMNNLGFCYENGIGVEVDIKEAARW